MAISIYTPSGNWPSAYNSTMDQLDTINVADLEDTNISDHPYDHAVLEWDSGTSMWVDSGILTATLEPVYAVWDSTCKDSGYWLSRDDRVGYEDSNYNGAQATLGSDTVWKYYFEISNFDCNIRCNHSYCRFGVGYHTNCADPINNRQHWYYQGDGYLKDNNNSIVKSGISGIGQGDYIGFAVEVIGTTCKVWVRDGDGDWIDGDPELGTSPSFEFDTNGYEIFPIGFGVWLSYVELITKDDYFEHGRPEGFYELRTNNFSTTTTTTSTTTTSTTTSTTTTSTTTITYTYTTTTTT